MSSSQLHPHSKITPLNSENPDIACTSSEAINALNLNNGEDVPTYGELQTQIQSPSAEGLAVGEGFDGTAIDLAKSPFPIKNDLFEGQLHVLMRDLPGNTYDFAGEKGVLWEIQIQGKFRRQIKGPIYLALELPQHEKYKVTAPMRLVIKACQQLMKTMGHKDVHISFGGNEELPHMGAPAFHSFDRVVITPPGQTPPTLGTHMPKTQSDIQRRKNFFKSDTVIDLESTYTFSMKNRRFDPINWKAVGVPIVKQFTVSRYTEAVRLSVYEVLEENGKPVEDPKGSVTAMAKRKHTKRNTFLWIKLARKQAPTTTK